MNGILFLYPKEVNAKERKHIWEDVQEKSGSMLIMDPKKLKNSTNTANYIITHRAEYNSSVLDGIEQNISIVVFTGHFTNRTIEVDNKRENTYWLPFNMLYSPDPLLKNLFDFMHRAQEPNLVTNYIKSMSDEFFGVRDKLRDISPYLLLGEDNLTKSQLQKFEEIKKGLV